MDFERLQSEISAAEAYLRSSVEGSGEGKAAPLQRKSGGGSKPARPSAPPKAYTYSLNLANGNKYVGSTSNITRRLGQHFSGNGAKWTQKHPPVSVNHVQVCRSIHTAKAAEKIVTTNMKRYHGSDLVRGAGHTSSK